MAAALLAAQNQVYSSDLQVIEQGTAAEVRAFLEGLERELSPVLSGFPLTEPMFQLMCHPVGAGAHEASSEGLERELSPMLSGLPLSEPVSQLMCCTAGAGAHVRERG
eukprot:1146003-Pelagomonas_calceolata.AAC.6